MQKSIAIVDDHILIAKALSAIIEQFKNYTVLFECENGKVLIDHFQNHQHIPDIVLLDISMPVMDGFETATWLTENHPGVQIMALTMQADEDSLFRMIKCGARGYVQKNVHPVDLEKALDILCEKGIYYSDWAAERIYNKFLNDDRTGEMQFLSQREKEFLSHVCTDLTYKEIAERMFCSPRTVESYRDSLFEKLGVKSRVALALYAVKAGLHKL